MASIIRIKRSPTAGNPSTLGAGELAYSALAGTQSNGGDRLYIGFGTETAGDAANHFVIGGKYFTDMLDHVTGTLTASSAILVDANSKVDQLKTTNLNIGGSGTANTIASSDTNGNIVLDPNGTGYVSIVGTNALVIPSGTTAQQSPTVTGAIRFNSDNVAFEGYNGSAWTSLGGVRSVDGLTYIRAETSSGASNDELEFFAAAADNTTSTKYLGLNRTRLAVLPTTTSTSTTTGALTVAGGAGIVENLWVGGTSNIAGATTLQSALTYGGVTLSNAVTGTGNMVLSASPTFTGTVTAPSATGISVGTPTLGTLTGAATFTSATSVTDTIGTLNQILSKLVPTQPSNFPTASLTISGATSYRIAVAQASQALNGNSGLQVAAGSTVSTLRASTFSTNTLSTQGPGDNGTITVLRNTSTTASHVLTVGNTTATVVTATASATTNGSAVITLTPVTGVIQAGHKFLASGTGFGGLSNGASYYVQSITGNQATLKLYSTANGGSIGADFSASSTATGTLTFTAQDDAGTTTTSNTSLVIANNLAFPTSTPGFWETIDVSASGTSVPAGWNTVQILHSGAGNTNTASWYYDSSSPGTPVVTGVSITAPASPNYRYSSGVAHFDGGAANSWTLSATANRLSGDTYPTSNNFATGVAGGAFAAPATVSYATAGVTTPLAQNLFVASGSATIPTTASIITGFGQSSTGPSIQVANSYATGSGSFTTALNGIVLYKSTTTGSTTVLDENSIFFNALVGGASTPAAYRVPNPGSTDTPAFTAGQTAFNSQSGTVQTYDAKIVGGVLRHSTTNYSTGYYPAGPNFSTHAADQYFTFVFIRTGVSKFGIVYTAPSGIAGMWVAMPGTGGTSGTTSSLNKWLSLGIDNSLADGASLGGNINLGATTQQTVNASFGTLSSTNATNNEIWVRIKLTANQTITALYLRDSTV